MKLINASFKILHQEDGIENLYKHIELCGRTCYKSENKISENDSKSFVDNLCKHGHTAMLEHGTIYLAIIDSNIRSNKELVDKYVSNPYSKVKSSAYANVFLQGINKRVPVTCITTNYRVIKENGWEEDLSNMVSPFYSHQKRVTVKFILSRQIANEFVRHRAFSFAQESTRFCNYSLNKFGNELTFIQPFWLNNGVSMEAETSKNLFKEVLEKIENAYMTLLKEGWKPQQAASILPNALKTELVMTGYISDWKHFFDLRSKGITGSPHPQAKELASALEAEFIKQGFIV